MLLRYSRKIGLIAMFPSAMVLCSFDPLIHCVVLKPVKITKQMVVLGMATKRYQKAKVSSVIHDHFHHSLYKVFMLTFYVISMS